MKKKKVNGFKCMQAWKGQEKERAIRFLYVSLKAICYIFSMDIRVSKIGPVLPWGQTRPRKCEIQLNLETAVPFFSHSSVQQGAVA